MELLLLSLLAGILTVLSPCILPLLPVVLTGSLAQKDRWAPAVIILSLAVSVILFTLLIRGTTALLGVPSAVWLVVSGIIIIVIGATLAFPAMWESITARFNLLGKTNRLVMASNRRSGYSRNVLLGASLGPVFTSCSPTYGLILAAVLPVSFAAGLAYLMVYTLGLSAVMLAIAYGGQRIVAKLQWAADPHGKFRKVLGIFLLVVGIIIATGLIKDIEAWLVDAGIDGTRLENIFLE